MMTVQQFRQRCVDPMGEESDHVHIVALTNALQARLRSCLVGQPFPTLMIEGVEDALTSCHWNCCLMPNERSDRSAECTVRSDVGAPRCVMPSSRCPTAPAAPAGASLSCVPPAPQVPIRVLYLDRSMYSGGDAAAVNHHDFIPDEPPAGRR